MGRKRKPEDEAVILRQNLVKRRSGDEASFLLPNLQNTVKKRGSKFEALEDKKTTNLDQKEIHQIGKENCDVSRQNAGNDGTGQLVLRLLQ